MLLNAFLEGLKKQDISYECNVSASRLTTFRIGGNVDVLVNVSSESQLKEVLKIANENDVPCFCIGKGSNLLVSDDGVEGAFISLSGINGIDIQGNTVTCGAGVSLAALCKACQEASLTGLEFAYGIPGSVGGAVFMNAGAYGGEMSQVIKSVTAVDKNANSREYSLQEAAFGYRESIFKEKGLYITSVKLELKSGKREEITACMDELTNRRKEKQPLEFPSAGSTFKRPEGYFAGALIEKNGLKGTTVGGAQVSEKHAGFIINRGGATSNDVLMLIDKIRNTVLENDGVLLSPEVLFVGRVKGRE